MKAEDDAKKAAADTSDGHALSDHDETAKDGLRKQPVAARADSSSVPSQPVRAINEDDDGYDPYSDLHDRHSSEPLFEADPWD